MYSNSTNTGIRDQGLPAPWLCSLKKYNYCGTEYSITFVHTTLVTIPVLEARITAIYLNLCISASSSSLYACCLQQLVCASHHAYEGDGALPKMLLLLLLLVRQVNQNSTHCHQAQAGDGSNQVISSLSCLENFGRRSLKAPRHRSLSGAFTLGILVLVDLVLGRPLVLAWRPSFRHILSSC